MTDPYVSQPLSYATVDGNRPPGVGAAVAIMFGGLSLIVLGGCFLIGVLARLTETSQTANPFSPAAAASPMWSAKDTIFLCVLYALAFMCFAAGAWVFVISVRKLMAR